MPLVRIDLAQGRSEADLAAIGDGVHRAIVETVKVPADDRFQIVTEHPRRGLVFDPNYLGVARSEGIVFIQIALSRGRTVEVKKALYAAIARNLSESPGVRPEDVFVNLVEVGREDWSFGNGIAQYAP